MKYNKLLVAAATEFEIKPFADFLNQNGKRISQNQFQSGNLRTTLLITGVGMTATGIHLGFHLAKNTYHMAIHAGIAGSFRQDIHTGTLVQIVSEQFGDLGAEEANGNFTDIFDLGLLEPDRTPFRGKRLWNNTPPHPTLPQVHGLTVNKVHGQASTIHFARERFQTDVESMEGAAFFLTCIIASVPFWEIRCISNLVEPRNRQNWNIPLAVRNLNDFMINFVQAGVKTGRLFF